MSKKRKPFLLIVILFAMVLLFMSGWIIRQNSQKTGDAIVVQNLVVSTELGNKIHLTGAVSKFPYGTRQVCLRFDYSKAAMGGELKIVWLFENKPVQSDSYELSEEASSKIYCLVKENGHPLPKGSYSVGIFYNLKNVVDSTFEIY